MVKKREVSTIADLLTAQPILGRIAIRAKKQGKTTHNIWSIYEQAKREAYFYLYNKQEVFANDN